MAIIVVILLVVGRFLVQPITLPFEGVIYSTILGRPWKEATLPALSAFIWSFLLIVAFTWFSYLVVIPYRETHGSLPTWVPLVILIAFALSCFMTRYLTLVDRWREMLDKNVILSVVIAEVLPYIGTVCLLCCLSPRALWKLGEVLLHESQFHLSRVSSLALKA